MVNFEIYSPKVRKNSINKSIDQEEHNKYKQD